jgi:hypothetical protein
MFHTAINSTNGGLAFDPSDSSLYIGTFGAVYHYSRTGNQLGFFSIPDPSTFIDGLELEGATPTNDASPPTPEGAFFSVVPNPSRGRISFVLSGTGPKRIWVYDVSGRLVREMFGSVDGQGPDVMTWDGRETTGSPAAGGVYVARAETGGQVATARFVLLH